LGTRQVRPPDSFAQIPTRTKASPGERIHWWIIWRTPKSTSLKQKMVFNGIKKKGERADLIVYLKKATNV
jgi:cytochrome c2